MKYQLSLDTCTKACSVALTPLEGGGKTFSWFEILDRGHAEILASKAQELMQQANISAKNINQIAVTIGPGTFTGARIALSFARMFAAARTIPIVALNSLQAVAFNAVAKLPLKQNDIIYVAIDARRGQVYFASFNNLGQEIIAPTAINCEDAAKKITLQSYTLGTGRALLLSSDNNLDENLHFPNAQIFGELVKNHPPATAPVSPLYLRAADAKLPQKHPIGFTQG